MLIQTNAFVIDSGGIVAAPPVTGFVASPQRYCSAFQFEPYPNAYCPKCGQQTVWTANENVEDNAGDYCICVTCFHDWHMYSLGGYYGIDETRERARQILSQL